MRCLLCDHQFKIDPETNKRYVPKLSGFRKVEPTTVRADMGDGDFLDTHFCTLKSSKRKQCGGYEGWITMLQEGLPKEEKQEALVTEDEYKTDLVQLAYVISGPVQVVH